MDVGKTDECDFGVEICDPAAVHGATILTFFILVNEVGPAVCNAVPESVHANLETLICDENTKKFLSSSPLSRCLPSDFYN